MPPVYSFVMASERVLTACCGSTGNGGTGTGACAIAPGATPSAMPHATAAIAMRRPLLPLITACPPYWMSSRGAVGDQVARRRRVQGVVRDRDAAARRRLEEAPGADVL